MRISFHLYSTVHEPTEKVWYMELSGFIPNALTYGLGNDMGNGSSVTPSLFNLPFKTVELRARFFTIM